MEKLADEIINWLETQITYGDDPMAELELVTTELPKILCKHLGHQPIADQCNKPEHDYCGRCGESTPGQAER